MKAACSAKKAGTFEYNCMFLFVYVLRVTYVKDGTVYYEATDPPRI